MSCVKLKFTFSIPGFGSVENIVSFVDPVNVIKYFNASSFAS